MKNHSFTARLGFALTGIRSVFANERSFRTQCVWALLAVVVVILLRPGWLWASVICVMVVLVLALELMNSALEALIDRVHPAIAPEIKVAKDAAAGAVLVASLGALVVGAMMLAARFQL
jgi:undecaprenol kinase